jgi:UDP-glucose 4-epimerase
MNILVTGGTGFIGSHASMALLNAGHDVSIIDNLSNSDVHVIKRLEMLSSTSIDFEEVDITNKESLELFFNNRNIEGVMHFAGMKAVSESTKEPLMYFQNNIIGTINLLASMKKFNVKKLIFSSSATVYGDPSYLPIDENHPTCAINPYGRTKLHLEEMIRDLAMSDPDFSAICLRYFNPIGAHESYVIGENPSGVPNNLIPYLIKVAAKKYPHLSIYGDDYDTSDGSGVRDYIHVQDLVLGHLAALDALLKVKLKTNFNIYNLGTGKGTSVFEIVEMFEKVTGINIPVKIAERRPGDIAASYASISKANLELNWESKFSLEEMIRSSWNFYLKSLK